MKLWESTAKASLRRDAMISKLQYGFMARKSTINAMCVFFNHPSFCLLLPAKKGTGISCMTTDTWLPCFVL